MPPSDNPLLFRRTPRSLPRHHLRQFAEKLRETVAAGRSFSCLLTDDRELRRLNRQFLGKDYPTDVLSFPHLSSGDPSEPLGEMAVSVQRADEQAREFGHSLEDEVGILMLHGLLHLLGMDHEKDRGKMKRAESRWRNQLGLPASLTERAET